MASACVNDQFVLCVKLIRHPSAGVYRSSEAKEYMPWGCCVCHLLSSFTSWYNEAEQPLEKIGFGYK